MNIDLSPGQGVADPRQSAGTITQNTASWVTGSIESFGVMVSATLMPA